MRRAIGKKKKALLHKQPQTAVTREINTTGSRGPNRFMEVIRARGGRAHVCVIRSVGGIGDVLMTTPALRELKRLFPNLVLTYAVDRHRSEQDPYWHLVKNASFIDEVVDARFVDRNKFDAVIDVSSVCIRYEHKGLPPLNRIDLFGRAMGMNYMSDKLPFYKVEVHEKRWTNKVLVPMRNKYKKIVDLHTASFDGKRSWPPEKYVELLKYARIHHPDIGFLLFDFNQVISDIGRFSNIWDCSGTNIREMAALINECDLLVGPDSGPMHLAGAMSIPSVVIFGSTPARARINYYPEHEAVTLAGLGCLGCWYAACPIGTKCMKDLEMSTVYDKILEKLGV